MFSKPDPVAGCFKGTVPLLPRQRGAPSPPPLTVPYKPRIVSRYCAGDTDTLLEEGREENGAENYSISGFGSTAALGSARSLQAAALAYMAREIPGNLISRRFEEQDRKSPPPKNPILFVGASMIVRWDVKKFFPDLETINRGFGGSEMIDVLHYVDRIVIPYKPRIVVLYEGDNDTAAGTSPEQVARNFEALVQKIHDALPQTKIVDISVKPSLARWAIVDKQQATNLRCSGRFAQSTITLPSSTSLR